MDENGIMDTATVLWVTAPQGNHFIGWTWVDPSKNYFILFPQGFPITSIGLMKPQRKWENDGK